jgi:2'-5' RNA ligase
LGVVLPVPQPAALEIDGLRRACGEGMLDRVRPHVTLVPPVNVREDELSVALALLGAAAADARPFTVELGPPATFVPDTPVLYLRVGGDGGALDRLRRLRDRIFVPPFERALTWDFVPHVTVADELTAERLDAAVGVLADYQTTVAFDRVHLLEEQRNATGHRVWVPVADALFGRRRIVGRGGIELVLDVGEVVDPDGLAFADRFGPVVDPDGLPSDHDRRLVLTARRDGGLIALARGWEAGHTAHLVWLAVDEGHRGLGVATQLVRAFESAAVDDGCTMVLAGPLPDDLPDAFYEGMGYRPRAIGVRSGARFWERLLAD